MVETQNNVTVPDVRLDVRADVRRSSFQGQVESKFDPKDKVWVRNPATGIFEWIYYVDTAEYDSGSRSWSYELKDEKGTPYKFKVAEGDLRPAK
ncbi:hypothetical protein MMC06_006413 [Schaereria dolodes]|nr:hypothetical protein [Schaereria dolodes]